MDIFSLLVAAEQNAMNLKTTMAPRLVDPSSMPPPYSEERSSSRAFLEEKKIEYCTCSQSKPVKKKPFQGT